MKLCLLVLIFLPLVTFGQISGLNGRILDRQGAVVPNYRITATKEDGKEFSAVTSEKGEYRLRLPTGEYTLLIDQKNSGFCPLKIRGYIVVDTVEFMSLDIVLKYSVASHSGENCRNKIIVL